MEIHEFAHSVLFSAELDTKLARPIRLTDNVPGRSMGQVHAPVRPAGMSLVSGRSRRVNFPTRAQLNTESMRGRALHFFANHELLALELMALALLRFPDAPPKFRRTLVATMRDEQKHMRLYMKRMAELGVELGEMPMNRFFWTAVSEVTCLSDFVARMSLTFEQANLDFALHYQNLFVDIGDHKTASIMGQVLEDEVRHVKHGLTYFQKWRPNKNPLWDEFCDCLPFPLNAARAKGTSTFTTEYRRRAGLPDDFIASLQLYRHSKGRSPSIHVFNPDANQVEAGGGKATNQVRRALHCDLETLPLFLAAEDDLVLAQKTPSPRFLRSLLDAGFTIPQFAEIDLNSDRLTLPAEWTNRKFSALETWGWNQQVGHFFNPLDDRLLSAGRLSAAQRLARRRLNDKSWLTEQLPSLLESTDVDWSDPRFTQTQPKSLSTVSRILDARDEYYALGYHAVVVKAPFGTSGRGAIRLLQGEAQDKRIKWIERHLGRGASLVIEPWYERRVDLSYLFRIEGNCRVKHLGLTSFLTDRSGRYRGTRLGALSHCLPPDVRPFVFRGGGKTPWLKAACATMAEALAVPMNDADYTGLAGFDLMIVRDLCGDYRVRMPLELNARPTMGHIALRLQKKIGPRSCGLWWWLSIGACQKAGYATLADVSDALSRSVPTRVTPGGHTLETGVVFTTDPESATQTITALIVALDLDQLVQSFEALGLPNPIAYPIVPGVSVCSAHRTRGA